MTPVDHLLRAAVNHNLQFTSIMEETFSTRSKRGRMPSLNR